MAHEVAPLEVLRLGRVPYREALELQHRMVEERLAGRCADRFVFVEHEPVITLGRGFRGARPEIPGVEVVEVERGGEATYHGPGQLVAYPILLLSEPERDLHRVLHALEEAIIEAIAPLSICGVRVGGATGVWVEHRGAMRKVASLGIAVRRWVTFHGLALNVSTDLRGFEGFHPCGFGSEVMASLEGILGAPVDRAALEDRLAAAAASRLRRALAPEGARVR